MAQDDFLVEYLSDCVKRGMCEIGMHPHAWDTPPRHQLDGSEKGRPFLMEYPAEIMREKLYTLHDFLTERFACEMVSHRAGRWVINGTYIELLQELGYLVDCSVTPGIDWSKTMGATAGGPDYTSESGELKWIGSEKRMLEIPMTVQKMRLWPRDRSRNPKTFLKNTAQYVLGRNVWLRPALSSNEEMELLLRQNTACYAEFMMHSSELMPGGSPFFQDERAIDELYGRLEQHFDLVSSDYTGRTLKEFYLMYIETQR
jgi:hypothetical protein